MNPEKVCEEIIKCLFINAGSYMHQVTRRELRKCVITLRGMDERTTDRWIDTLLILEYLKIVAEDVYAINELKVSHLIVKAIKNNAQTKMM